MKYTPFALVVMLVFLLSSCTKTEEVIIEGNTAPPDPTIENVIKENYIHKLYISLLGRKATDNEFDEALTTINQGNLSAESRLEVIESIQSKPEFFNNEFTLMRGNLLNNLDTNEVTLYLAVFENEIANSNDPDYTAALETEKARLEPLSTLLNELTNGAIDMPEAHRRCVNNFFYDEINMGTENFVVSMYQNFLARYPSTEELEKASTMVDNLPSIIFYEVGDSKDDFINIFMASDDYFEGQVNTLFERYLFRSANSEESASLGQAYKNSLNYQALQQSILSSDEYVGL